jgi:hypothetical protein
VKEWMDREYRMKNLGVMDRIRECFRQFFETTMEGETYGKEIIEGLTIMALATAEQAIDLRLAGKIVKFGIQKGIEHGDFLILKAYYMATTMDWNGYIQISKKLKWRHNRNTRIIKGSRFMDLYVKTEDLKRSWDANKVVDKRTVTHRRTV